MIKKDIIKIINKSFKQFIDYQYPIQKGNFYQDIDTQLDKLFEDYDLSIEDPPEELKLLFHRETGLNEIECNSSDYADWLELKLVESGLKNKELIIDFLKWYNSPKSNTANTTFEEDAGNFLKSNEFITERNLLAKITKKLEK